MVRRFIQSILNKRGIRIIKPALVNGSPRFSYNELTYDVVTPSANYSPWLGDSEFMQVYSDIKQHTLVDIYRCYELWELAGQINRNNPTAAFLEIGVWRGGTAAIVGKKLSLSGANTDFYLADTFTGVAKASSKDGYYSGGEHADTSIGMVESIINGKYNHYRILQGIFPDDTAHLVNNEAKFGYCHIDVDVYESANGIVNWIWDKMVLAGVIVFDDYGFHYCDGITRFVNEQKGKSDRIVLHNLNGHAIIVKIK